VRRQPEPKSMAVAMPSHHHVDNGRSVALQKAARSRPHSRSPTSAMPAVLDIIESNVGGQPTCPAPPWYRMLSVSRGWSNPVPTYTTTVSQRGRAALSPDESDLCIGLLSRSRAWGVGTPVSKHPTLHSVCVRASRVAELYSEAGQRLVVK